MAHLPSHRGKHLHHPKLRLPLHPPPGRLPVLVGCPSITRTPSLRSYCYALGFSPLLLLRPPFRPSSLLPEYLRQSTSFPILPPCKPGHALPRPTPPGRMLSGPQLQPCTPASLRLQPCIRLPPPEHVALLPHPAFSAGIPFPVLSA